MNNLAEMKRRVGHVLAVSVFMVSLVSFAAESSATLTALVSFDGTNGYLPQGGLVQDDQGNFYGTLSYGGWFDVGTVYRVSLDGTCVILVTFDGNNGSHPVGLIRGADGSFYGTTLEGGPEGSGSVFRISACMPQRTSPSCHGLGHNERTSFQDEDDLKGHARQLDQVRNRPKLGMTGTRQSDVSRLVRQTPRSGQCSSRIPH